MVVSTFFLLGLGGGGGREAQPDYGRTALIMQ